MNNIFATPPFVGNAYIHGLYRFIHFLFSFCNKHYHNIGKDVKCYYTYNTHIDVISALSKHQSI